MEYETQGDSIAIARDRQLHDQVMTELVGYYNADREAFKKAVSEPDWYKRFKPLTDRLRDELDCLIASHTPAAANMFMSVYDDLTGNLSSQMFQIQTLMSLAQRFSSNQNNFQWFITSSAPSFDLVGSSNPFFLGYEMFSIIEDPIATTVQDPRSTTQLSKDERPLKQAQKPSPGGYYFLKRRQWLLNYLTAIRFYRNFHTLLPLIKARNELTEKFQITPQVERPDPDKVSTDIPVINIQPPQQTAWNQPLALNIPQL